MSWTALTSCVCCLWRTHWRPHLPFSVQFPIFLLCTNSTMSPTESVVVQRWEHSIVASHTELQFALHCLKFGPCHASAVNYLLFCEKNYILYANTPCRETLEGCNLQGPVQMVKFKRTKLVWNKRPKPDCWGLEQHLVKKNHKPKNHVTCPCTWAAAMPVNRFVFFHEHTGMVCTGNKKELPGSSTC